MRNIFSLKNARNAEGSDEKKQTASITLACSGDPALDDQPLPPRDRGGLGLQLDRESSGILPHAQRVREEEELEDEDGGVAGGDHGGVVGEGLATLEIETPDAFVDELGDVGSAVLEGGRDPPAEGVDVGEVGDEVSAEAAAAHGVAELLELGLGGGEALRQFGRRLRTLLRKRRRGYRSMARGLGIGLEEESADVEGEVEGMEVVVEVEDAAAEGVDGGGEGGQLGHRSLHRRIPLLGLHSWGNSQRH